MVALLEQVDATVVACTGDLQDIGAGLQQALEGLRRSTAHLLNEYGESPDAVLGKAFDYMMQTGYVMGAWHLARSAVLT